MKKNILVLLFILPLILLVSCEIGFFCDLYIKDIVDIANGVYDVGYVDSVFVMETTGENEELEDFIRQNFRDVENLRVVEDDYYNMYLVFDSKVPIITLDNISKLDDKDLFAIVTKSSISKANANEIQFGLYMNKDKYEDIKIFIEEQFFSTISMSKIHLYIFLYNDFLTNLKITLNAIYVNYEPIISPTDFILKKDEKLELILSDIIKDYIYNNDYLLFGKIWY